MPDTPTPPAQPTATYIKADHPSAIATALAGVASVGLFDEVHHDGRSTAIAQ
jgi:hypothetical protein